MRASIPMLGDMEAGYYHLFGGRLENTGILISVGLSKFKCNHERFG
jgi:hypothetical protein